VGQQLLGHQGEVGRAEVRAADSGERHVGRRRHPGRIDGVPLPCPGIRRNPARGAPERGIFRILLDLFRVSGLTGLVGGLTGGV
jgi:hypothetical protein